MDKPGKSISLDCAVCARNCSTWRNIQGRVICSDCALVLLGYAVQVLDAYSPVAFLTCLQSASEEVMRR